MYRALFAAALLITTSIAAPAIAAPDPAPPIDERDRLEDIRIPGLVEQVRVRRDGNDIAHIFALTELDAVRVLGWVHAQDRFFQMDVLRRTFSGTSAEMFGGAALPSDVQLRTLGLRRAAEASLPALTATSRAWLTAYAEGVNAWLAQNPLPPEYGLLELTRASVPAWTEVDSVVIGKGLAFGLSFDLEDIDRTTALLTFQQVGAAAGFDGTALFFQDLYRTAPFDPSVSIPDFLVGGSLAGGAGAERAGVPSSLPASLPAYLTPRVGQMLREVRQRAADIPALRRAFERSEAQEGSNWWLASGELTASGAPMLANDPHLSLDNPSVFYEVQLRVKGGPDEALNVFGVSFPGTPSVILGCNPWLCWGGTVHPMDVTDVYVEQLIFDPILGLPIATVFGNAPEPLVPIFQTFMVNVIGNGVDDAIVDAGLGPGDGGLTLIVPRRNHGPIVALDVSDPGDPIGLSVQYTGWGPTREVDALRSFARARTIDDFKTALQSFDFGSQNWGVASIDGSIAYFTSAELPLREDLQTLGAPAGVPPYIVRDGTHGLPHEWLPLTGQPQPGQALPYEILPFAEMPQVVNPERGYILNANNDPVGTSLDNVPFNEMRPGGGAYYLSPGYATGFRMGRLQRLFDAALAGGAPLSIDDFKTFQANNQLLDAEVLTPYLLGAFTNAAAPGAPPELIGLAADPGVTEAIARLAAWDFGTPTGIQAGYDPGDDPNALPMPSLAEVEASIAATIYATWRSQVIGLVIDDTLATVGLKSLAPGSALALSALRNLLDTFDATGGVGASGIPFFFVPGIDDPAAARDVKLLAALRAALDRLASDDFAAAFGNSTDQNDYRWGYLHRIVFDHPMGGPLNVPPDGALPGLSPDLPGLARSGGLGALDASAHNARADGANQFMFGSGPARRFAGVMLPSGPDADEVIPAGTSGVPGNPYRADQLRLWLVNDYHPFAYRPDDVVGAGMSFQVFMPAPTP